VSYRKYLYVAGVPGCPVVKIGRSMSPAQRVAELRKPGYALTPSGVDREAIALLAHWRGNAPVERWIHRQFTNRRVVGEWFDLGPDPVATVEQALTRLPKRLQLDTRYDPGAPPTRRFAQPARRRLPGEAQL
jgi:T5orf172 domain